MDLILHCDFPPHKTAHPQKSNLHGKSPHEPHHSNGAAISRADKYHVYRPLLDLIGFTEETDKKRGYNKTLGYGHYTGGAVNLVGMTMKQIDEL